MIFQLAEAFYKKPNLYNELLKHMVIPRTEALVAGPGKDYDFQLIYEHNAHAIASRNPDYRYAQIPPEVDLSDLARDAYYKDHAVVVLPGLGTARSAKAIAVPGAVATARAAKAATQTIPIVFAIGFDPVEFGLVMTETATTE